jgi:1-acyl-sn-glycerol-3-phosphate acyltransferase
MRFIISAVIWIVGTVITAAALVSSLVIKAILFPFPWCEKLVHAQCFWWSDALIAMNPYWKLDIKGLEHIDRRKTYVIVANHQSLADIIIIYQIRMYFKWIAKKELLKVPLIGGLLWVNDHVLISRGDFGSIKEVYQKAAQRLKSGVSVLFFPEGTRSGTDEMNEFQNGAFKLAIKEKRPVLPIYLGGTREAIPKGGWVFKARASGCLTVMPAIDTAGYQTADYIRLRDLVRGQLQAAAARSVKYTQN